MRHAHPSPRSFFLGRLGLLGAALLGSLASGCGDRQETMGEEELRELCVEHCEVSFWCGTPEDANLEECVEGCIPRTEKQLAACYEGVLLESCWAGLSCGEVEAYRVAFYHFLETREYAEDFPCRDDFELYIRECTSINQLD